MRFTMICIGSTGDVKPYVLLGNELQKRGHDVAICAFTEFETLAKQNGLRFYPLSGDVHAFMSSIMKPGTKGVTYLKQIRSIFLEILSPFLHDLEAACADAEVIVATYFGEVIQSIAEQRGVPFIKTHYFPMDPTAQMPISSAPGLRMGRVWNRTSYMLAYLIISTLEMYYLKNWRRGNDMPARRLRSAPRNQIGGRRVPVLYAMSPLLVSRPADWDDNIYMTGFWLDQQETEYEPSPELAAFLAAKPKPVYIGFGSMTSGDMQETLGIVLEAVKHSGIRAVLATGWSNSETEACDNVYVMRQYVPHDWLFTRVSAVVHHGGAGTTASGLCAGKPTLVIPFGGDQPFWALRVRLLGLGPKPIRREKLTVVKMAQALTRLMTEDKYRIAAERIGKRLRAENGISNAADIILRETERWPAEHEACLERKRVKRYGSHRYRRGKHQLRHKRIK